MGDEGSLSAFAILYFEARAATGGPLLRVEADAESEVGAVLVVGVISESMLLL